MDWPVHPATGIPLTLLISIGGDFLRPFNEAWMVQPDWRLSVFALIDDSSARAQIKASRLLAVHHEGELDNLNQGASSVLFHPEAEGERYPPEGAPSPLPAVGMTSRQVLSDDAHPRMPDRGKLVSKIGGVPAWAQDPIQIDGYRYAMQLDGHSLSRKLNRATLSRDGVAFLFLPEQPRQGDTGRFFIQFT
jgi:hypothetical protein